MKIKAFTLIELTAVVSIIAILTGIVVYGINDWKADANLKKSIAHSNNVKSKLATSLVGEWKMEENDNFHIYDSGRLGNTGMADGTFTTQTACPEGNRCIYSQGAEIYFYGNPPILKFKTVCFWIKSSNANFDIINSYNDFHIYSSGGLITFNIYSADNVYTSIAFTGATINDNSWHFICGSIDNNSTFYGTTDGEARATGSAGVSSFGRKSLSSMVLGIDPVTFYMDDLIIFGDSIY